MRPVKVRKGMGKSFVSLALFLGLGILLTFNPSVTSSAAANDEPMGMLSGGGVWMSTCPLLQGQSGVTSFRMKTNFPGNANGGFVYVSTPSGWYRVAVIPETVVILDGTWQVWPAPGENVTVGGYAMWAIGKVVGANREVPGTWAILGAYDGDLNGAGYDYLLSMPIFPNSVAAAGALDSVKLSGNSAYPLWVYLAQGDAHLVLFEDE